MNRRLLLRIAWHLLRARMKQSLVAATGVLFGIASFIALISFMTGLNQLLDGLVMNRSPHIRIYNEIRPSDEQPIERASEYAESQNFVRSVRPRETGQAVRNSAAVIEALRKDPRVKDVAPKVSAPVFYFSGSTQIAGQINGVEPLIEKHLFALQDYVMEGDLRELKNSSNGIFLGKGIADKMMLQCGDIIQVSAAGGDPFVLKVIGILQFGLADVDDSQSYTNLRTTQQLLGVSSSYFTDLQVKLHDISLAPALAREYAQQFRVDTLDIQTANAQFETGTTVRTIISYAVGITLLIVAGFGIYNILNMLIYEKMDSIAILKATGFSGSDVQRIFLSISTMIGVSGGIAGLVVGYGLSAVIDQVPFETQALPTIRTFPVNYNMTYYIIGMLFSLVTTYIAGIFPARKAARIDPVIIIRGK